MELDLDRWLELLESRIVSTSRGPYIAVKDLKDLTEEFKGMKVEDKPTGEKKTFLGARKAIMQDPEFLKSFGDRPPQAPADAGVVKPVAEKEEKNEAA